MVCSSGEDTGVDPARVFAQLGEVLYASEDFEHTYQAVCQASLLLVPGCDHASLLVRKANGLVTPVVTDDVARLIGELEREAGSGPCVDAVVDESPQLAPDLSAHDGEPWPELRRRIVATTPVRGMLGFRITHRDHKIAALNLFSDRPHGFTAEGVNHAAVLAAFCCVALRAAAEHQQASALRQGLASNREIGKAIGLLMAHHKIDDAEAFVILKAASNELNLKLSAVAARIVQGHVDQLHD